MIRILEIGLFLLPFAGYGVWLWLGKQYTATMLWGTLATMLVTLFLAAWLELSRAVPPDMIYVPPRLEDGRIVPGHAVRRTAP